MGFYRIPYILRYARYVNEFSTADALRTADFLDDFEGLNIERVAGRIARYVDPATSEQASALLCARRYCTYCGTLGRPDQHVAHLMDDSCIPQALLEENP